MSNYNKHVMIPSYCTQHSHNLHLQCFIYKSPKYKNKRWYLFLCKVLLLSHSPSSLPIFAYLCCSLLPSCCHLASFPWQQQIILGLFSSLSWFSPFSFSLIFHLTRKHLKTTYLLHTNPFTAKKGLRLNYP